MDATATSTAHDATIAKYREFVTTSFVAAIEPVVVDRAEGATVWDEDGTEYIDCFAGIAVVNAGHRHPKVIAAVKEQLDKVVHAATYIYHVPVVADAWPSAWPQIAPGRLQQDLLRQLRRRGDRDGDAPGQGLHRQARVHHPHPLLPRPHRPAPSPSPATRRARRAADRTCRAIAFAPAPYVYRNPFGTDDPEEVAERCADDGRVGDRLPVERRRRRLHRRAGDGARAASSCRRRATSGG